MSQTCNKQHKEAAKINEKITLKISNPLIKNQQKWYKEKEVKLLK